VSDTWQHLDELTKEFAEQFKLNRPDFIVEFARKLVARTKKPTLAGPDALARAVIAQDEELAKLRAVLAEALDEWTQAEEFPPIARIVELRRLANGE
jgi:hypothetical protein